MRTSVSRRELLKSLTAGAFAVGAGAGSTIASEMHTNKVIQTGDAGFNQNRLKPEHSRVALVKGNDRRGNMLKALEMIADDVKKGIGNKQVVIKTNFTRIAKKDWLASTHVDNIYALCELLSTFYKGKIIVAEGTGPGTPLDTPLQNYGYLPLKEKYNVEFFDLRSDDHVMTYILNNQVQPIQLRTSKLLLNPNTYVVSAAILKTHASAVVTLGLKNVVMAAPHNGGKGDNDRQLMHSGSVPEDPRFFNFNLFQMACHVVPDLVAIDGFVGMEKNELFGDPVEAKVAIASTDWLAADRVGTEVMGYDFRRIGYLRYCTQAGMGEADLTKIEVAGDPIGNCIKPFAPPSTMEKIAM